MAVNLAIHQHRDRFEPVVVFRSRGAHPGFMAQLSDTNTPFFEVCSHPRSRTVRQLMAILRELRPEIVVAHGYTEHIWGRIAALLARIPVIIQVEHATENYHPHRYLQAQFLAFFTNRLVCVSHGVRGYLKKIGLNRPRAQVIYNAINLREFEKNRLILFSERAKNVVMVAGFGKAKDHESLIKAAKILRDQGIPCKIIIAGGLNRFAEPSLRCIRTHQLENEVELLGSVPTEKIHDLLSQNQIFVLATHHEGLSTAVIEAMAAGCAVIGSRVVGVEELIEDGVTGYLVPPRDPGAIADRIRQILADPTEAEQIAAAGRRYAWDHFQIDRMVTEYEQLFKDELAKMNRD